MIANGSVTNELPEPGQLVEVRSRRWLVERVEERPFGESALVGLACADDDAQGQPLDVFWDYEIDCRILDEEGWADLARKGFDKPRHFAAFLNALRWNCVTSTDARLVQSPFRAGIKLEAYQIEPLRKALQLPLVNLFIADDTGLGKTIEAGLVARELLLRKKVQTIVVSAPPSVLGQWKAELEERFGLLFEILDRLYLTRMRRERGFGVNPWKTHSRFLVSHRLLTDPNYADPMRAWLGDRKRGSLLILDEAHHAAPSSAGRYGIETKFTRAIRDILGRFEHRLFLSATPHNGHSSSFSTLLELLDPHRFTRGVKVRKKALKEVMVRRLKDDIRKAQGGFPERRVERIKIDGLPEDAPELVLSKLLEEYRIVREKRFKSCSKRAQTNANLLVIGLQQRLLSSIEAFAQSLKVHTNTANRQRAAELESTTTLGKTDDRSLVTGTAGLDDERSAWQGKLVEKEEAQQIEAATAESEAEAGESGPEEDLWKQEVAVRDRMRKIADKARGLPDAKLRWLLKWIRKNLCPGLREFGESAHRAGSRPTWKDRRVLIFTENRQSTKRYLREMLEQAVEGTDRADERIEVIDGLTSTARRKEIQRRFNAAPSKDPLRILLATDAAREGLNFQAHCADLFHYDLPWNPGRIEQRNGRIDRKLQPEPVVRCHYFVLPQRAEDRVLDVLARKTETIKRELGSLSNVVAESIEQKLRSKGIRHENAIALARELKGEGVSKSLKEAAAEELESARARENELAGQLERCRNVLERSKKHVVFDPGQFRDAISCALELLGSEPLRETVHGNGERVWEMPPLDRRAATDPSWAGTLDSLRAPRKPSQKIAEWRKEAPIRPVVFKDRGVLSDETVHLHLEQRVAQRLLARFRSQGFVHHDLSRACLAHTEDSIRRVVLLGRLLLFGSRAERLHEEIIPVAARWREPALRSSPLKAYARKAQGRALRLLERSLGNGGGRRLGPAIESKLLASAPQDVEELLPQLQPKAEEAARVAETALLARGSDERRKLETTLKEQRKRVVATLKKEKDRQPILRLEFDKDEARQLKANMKAWERRILEFDKDIRNEPAKVEALYRVRTTRVEPVGLVYLWPETN